MDSHLPIAGVRTRDQQEATAKCPLFVFIDELRRLPDAAFGDMERMLMFLTDHPVDSESLENCLTWDRRHYTRNLIDRTSMYELIAICWEIGQISAIHDHDDQHCWMSVPIGRLRIDNYRVLSHDLNTGDCMIERVDAIEMYSEQPKAVDPASPVHRVTNAREFNQRAVSLHIYSRPIDKCRIYFEETQTSGVIALSYTSTPQSRLSEANRRI